MAWRGNESLSLMSCIATMSESTGVARDLVLPLHGIVPGHACGVGSRCGLFWAWWFGRAFPGWGRL